MTTYSSRFFTYAPLFNLKFCFTDHARSPQNTIQYQTPSLWHGTLAAQPQHHHHHHHHHQHQHQHHCPPLPLQCRRGAQHLNHTTLYFLITLPFTSPLSARCASAELQLLHILLIVAIKIDNDNNIAHYHPLVAILRRLPVSLLPLLHILPFAAIHCVYLAIRQYHTSKLPQYTYRSRYRAIIYPNTW